MCRHRNEKFWEIRFYEMSSCHEIWWIKCKVLGFFFSAVSSHQALLLQLDTFLQWKNPIRGDWHIRTRLHLLSRLQFIQCRTPYLNHNPSNPKLWCSHSAPCSYILTCLAHLQAFTTSRLDESRNLSLYVLLSCLSFFSSVQKGTWQTRSISKNHLYLACWFAYFQ